MADGLEALQILWMLLGEGCMTSFKATDITVSLVDTNNQISRDIERAISEEINKRVKKNSSKVERRLKRAVDTWIRTSPEILSIQAEGVADSLNAQFGFPLGFGGSAAEAVVRSVVDSIGIEIQDFSVGLRGKINFYVQPENLVNLLTLPESSIDIVNGSLPWLDWLLRQGGRTIIVGYQYQPGNDGRSGGGTMVGGGFWRVPPQFSGVEDSNFITRALSGREPELNKIIQGLLE